MEMCDNMDDYTNTRGRVAVITGANAGLGFALAERLLQSTPRIHLCLACRNKSRAQNAVDKLRQAFPHADLSIVILDTSSVVSVQHAAQEIRTRYKHIDYLFLNAGIMKVTGVDWSYFWQGIFTSRAVNMLTTGEGLLMQEDDLTADGLQCTFQTNLFGHYQLIKELDDHLGSSQTSQIIWTSSSNAMRANYDITDLQHTQGKDPYSSSKFAMDILSVGLNSKMNKRNVYSHVVCPGLVMSNLTYGILPEWFWTLIMPLLWLLRIVVPGMTRTATNGAEALVWLSTQNPVKLDPMIKFQSLCGFTGKPYVGKEKMKILPEEGEQLIQKLDQMNDGLRQDQMNDGLRQDQMNDGLRQDQMNDGLRQDLGNTPDVGAHHERTLMTGRL